MGFEHNPGQADLFPPLGAGRAPRRSGVALASAGRCLWPPPDAPACADRHAPRHAQHRYAADADDGPADRDGRAAIYHRIQSGRCPFQTAGAARVGTVAERRERAVTRWKPRAGQTARAVSAAPASQAVAIRRAASQSRRGVAVPRPPRGRGKACFSSHCLRAAVARVVARAPGSTSKPPQGGRLPGRSGPT